MSERTPSDQSGEQTIWQGTPSQAVNLPVYLLLGIGVIVATVGLLYLRAASPPDATATGGARSVYPWVIIAIWLLGGIGALMAYLKVSTTRYVLTTERLRMTTGVLSTITHDIELRRVRDSIIMRPFWSRVVGIGDVHVLSADASTPRVVLTAIRDPDGVQSKLRSTAQAQWAKFGGRTMEVD